MSDYSASVFDALAADNYLKGLPREQFVDRLAFHFGEINSIHPFREGNGRAQCAFTRQLASDAGWSLDWSKVDRADLDGAYPEVRPTPGPIGLKTVKNRSSNADLMAAGCHDSEDPIHTATQSPALPKICNSGGICWHDWDRHINIG